MTKDEKKREKGGHLIVTLQRSTKFGKVSVSLSENFGEASHPGPHD